VTHFQLALLADPGIAETHNNLGYALLRRGQPKAALIQYQEAVQLNPGVPAAHNNLAWLLATSPDASIRNGAEAVVQAEQADRLTGSRNPMVLRTLAAAYAETGRYGEAVNAAGRALEMFGAKPGMPLADSLRREIQLYQQHQPFRDTHP
jgi:Flp pilus assembly protein TadD